MSPTFWRRFPTFAAGSLLGISFAIIYVQQRMIASSVKPLDDFQKNIGEVAAGQKLPLHFRLAKDWSWNKHFPCNLTLMKDPGNGMDRQELQTAVIQDSTFVFELAPLSEGNYVIRADVAECKQGEKRPLCYGQMQYFAFHAGVKGSTSLPKIELVPQNLPIPQ